MRNFEIGANDAGQRLDKYLKKLLPNASTGFLYKMLRKKNITLDGKKATGKELLKSSSRSPYFSVRRHSLSSCKIRMNLKLNMKG